MRSRARIARAWSRSGGTRLRQGQGGDPSGMALRGYTVGRGESLSPGPREGCREYGYCREGRAGTGRWAGNTRPWSLPNTRTGLRPADLDSGFAPVVSGGVAGRSARPARVRPVPSETAEAGAPLGAARPIRLEAADVAEGPAVGLSAVVSKVLARPVGAQAVRAVEHAGSRAVVEALAVAHDRHGGRRRLDAR